MYFIHYPYNKNIGYVWRGIKTTPRPKNSTAHTVCVCVCVCVCVFLTNNILLQVIQAELLNLDDFF